MKVPDMRIIPILLAALPLIAIISTPSAAQEAQSPLPENEMVQFEPPPPQNLPAKYSPENCEFEAAFPEEPFIKEMCDGGESGTECYNLASFTQTFGLDATVYVQVVCNAIGEDIKNKYDENVMTKTLEAMTKDDVTQAYSTSYSEDEQGRYKLAGLVGEGRVGVTPSMYIAQMWLGNKSAMTIEAQLIGEQFPESDGLFRDILSGIRYKDAAAPANETPVNQTAPPENQPE